MNKKAILTLIVATFFSALGFANDKAEKTVSGTVTELVNGEKTPVPFAYVYCEGTTISTYTDENGSFVLPLEENGKYTLRFSHAGYTVVEKNVKVKNNSYIADCKLDSEEVLLTQL